MDDSENAHRTVGYVGFMLGGLEGFRVTLLHVISLPEKEEFLFGSVSSKIVGHARNCAVWVVA